MNASSKRKKSNSRVAKEILARRGKVVSREVIRRFRKKEGQSPFHEVRKPKVTQLNREDRRWFADFLRLWDVEDFLHLCCSDEFYVYLVRRPNHQNDRIWATSLQDIPDTERIREIPNSVQCVGIFLCFSAKEMMWHIKPNGQSWDGAFFREVILTENVIPFLRDPTKVLDPEQVTFLHDRAPCMKALATQQLLRDSGIDFFGNNEWPGNSPDLNPCEHLGAIMKSRVEDALVERFPLNNATFHDLHVVLAEVLETMRYDRETFEALLLSYPERLRQVRQAQGGHTNF